MRLRQVETEENLWIILSDGCRLAARMWYPADYLTTPVPAILEYIPYRKRDGSRLRDEGMYSYMASHGYACIRVDIRGNGDSDGLMEDEYSPQELDDGIEIINWLATQPWCTGKVGIVGISWGGFNGLQIAAMQPEALKAIITICSTDDRYADDIHYMGGCLLNDNMSWSSQMLAYSSRPPDPALVGERWREMWLERLENMPLLAANWLRHQRRDEFWKHGSVCENYADITAAVYAVGGWADGYSNAIPRLVEGLQAPVCGLIGPWEHKYPHIARPGPDFDFLPEMRRWWDYWLKDIDNGVDQQPKLRAYIMDSVKPAVDYNHRPGFWIEEVNYPISSVTDKLLYLVSGGLCEDCPEEHQQLELCSPQHTGLSAGRWCAGMRLDMENPQDQRGDDAYSLCFDSDLLEKEMLILGAPVVSLTVALDRPQGMIAVRLCDIHPDGASTRITYGLLNLCHRDSHEFPEPLEPNKCYSVQVKLNDIGYRLPKGHKLRLAISTAYWPISWPSPEETTATITTGISSLLLPEYKIDHPELIKMQPAIPRGEDDVVIHREPASSRKTEQDCNNGTVTVTTIEDFGQKIFPATGLEVSSRVEERFTISPDDPLSAFAEAHWVMAVGRNEWQTRTVGKTTMNADKQNYYLIATLDAYEADEKIFSKEWKETIPRDL
ncbi:CocE/NonD family hydrolase [Kiloniella laminariae]|uniref:CocE/NonD family hydrolase n=1 Tax=Kiloniella laminariae TaxID=454162 RepID=A0ABT4LM15_9PROT|nr:CocE/NonD family hydrolase [Kiloniella laminariae]MCZ4282138.1 CocE/NonD family hydrolase [Kiloniella laminariae]